MVENIFGYIKIHSNCVLVISFLLLLSCGSSKRSNALELETFDAQKLLIGSGKFKFTAETAFSMQSNDVIDVTNALIRQTENANGRFSLSANNDYIIISLNKVKANLTYFGELRTAAYSDTRDTTIIFDQEPQAYKVNENEKKKTITLTFRIKNSTEQFNIKMLLFSNKTASVYIYSSNRTTIRYNGKVSSL
ncbi:DUF4251 domain-containing protein [Winogradskyella sp. PG-2]|uniref:DUF4251 domain-containing protein n=1 Tax=Winogradskyella sp. PG-2 TaxID=754409 RepID=UPI000458806B|nr:DUF4251 domain-containing protein [Winogradskyella sp. PG-2]BAO77310.1 hypothetical protein WPG_3080 [Winogradskyella sp. PG-2]